MTMPFDAEGEARILLPLLDRLIVEGDERAADPLRRVCGELEDERFFHRTAAFLKGLCRVLAGTSLLARHGGQVAERHEVICDMLQAGEITCPLDTRGWTVDFLTLDYQIRRYLPELVTWLKMLRRAVLPLIAEGEGRLACAA